MPITKGSDGVTEIAFGTGDVGFGRVVGPDGTQTNGLFFGQLPGPGPAGKRYDLVVSHAVRMTFQKVEAVSLLIGYLRGLEKEMNEAVISGGDGNG